MKLNQNCVRDVMLALEEQLLLSQIMVLDINDYSDKFMRKDDQTKYSDDEVLYTAARLIEAGYLNGKSIETMTGIVDVAIESITWNGHSFLDTIRDPKVWKATKQIASHLESVSITILSTIGSNVVNRLIDKHMPTTF